ncbi:hypothetical protein [uncultured Aureimonas sp.]|uniref:hypothetical protein n=1 Tax=uncultured Aureimonas sp. TaxID=1604662 RepID=UPI0025EC817C|nr:hypothetical protein [uncultured Aureimonas sp.]
MSARREVWLIGADPAFAAVAGRWCAEDGWRMSQMALGDALARRRTGGCPDLQLLDADSTPAAAEAAMLLSLFCEAPLVVATAALRSAAAFRAAGARMVLEKSGGSAGLGLLRPGADRFAALVAACATEPVEP